MVAPVLAAGVKFIGSFLASKGMDLLGSVFRGAVEKGTQKIADTIKEKTGIDVNDAAEGKLTDEQLLKLKEFELQNQELLLQHIQQARAQDLEEERIHQQDRASARAMQVEALKSGDKFATRFIYWYAAIVTCLTFGYVFTVTIVDVPSGNKRIVDTVLGFLLGVSLSAIIQFFFGSSKGSSEKQQQIGELSRQIGEMSQGRANR